MNAKELTTLIVVGVGAVLLLGFVGKKQVAAAAGAVGGLISGNNTITTGTAYDGAGVLGTLGAATNIATGSWMDDFGGWLGRNAYDAFH